MEAAVAAILSAIITGILGPILTIRANQKVKQSKLPHAPDSRIQNLRGKWHGAFEQITEEKRQNFDGIVFFRNEGKSIVGEIEYLGIHRNTKLSLYDGIFDGNFLKIEYKNEIGHIIQYGTAIMEMNAKGNECTGLFIGFSPSQEAIINGRVYFSKASVTN